MHFKIEMNCKTAKWEVFLEQYLFWRKIKGTSMQFDSYDAALAKWEETKVGPKPVWNTLALYAMTPETYTKYTAGGAPDLTAAPASSGVGHQTFSKAQTMAWVRMLATAARTGKVPSEKAVTVIAQTAPYLSTDFGYRPAELKYNFGN